MTISDSARQVEELTRRFSDLILRVEDTRETILGGGISDLPGFDTEVANLCQQINGISPEVAEAIEPLMARLIGALDSLSVSIRDAQESDEAQHGAPMDQE